MGVEQILVKGHVFKLYACANGYAHAIEVNAQFENVYL